MTPATFQFSADEIRSETATLSDCQTVAEMVPVLREEKGLMRKGWDAALRSAEAFKASSIANGQRADNAERKWQLEHENFTAEQGLTDQARAETKAAVKKGRWNLIKGIFWGLAIGAGAGAIYGASR